MDFYSVHIKEVFEKEVDINLWGPIHCIHALAPSMIERQYGKIITIGSDAGRVGEYNEAVYGACKGGMITLTKALAREFGKHGIIVRQSQRQATFLPQVSEHFKTKEEMLAACCRKAGLPTTTWSGPACTVLIYEAQVFAEKAKE